MKTSKRKKKLRFLFAIRFVYSHIWDGFGSFINILFCYFLINWTKIKQFVLRLIEKETLFESLLKDLLKKIMKTIKLITFIRKFMVGLSILCSLWNVSVFLGVCAYTNVEAFVQNER